MTRSGYIEDYGADDPWALIRWRGAVTSALRGERGQMFLRAMLASLDALPEPRLIESALVTERGCCALGATALHCGIAVADLDPYDREAVADRFRIAEALVAEIASVNDNDFLYRSRAAETPEQRFLRVRRWVVENIQSWEAT